MTDKEDLLPFRFDEHESQTYEDMTCTIYCHYGHGAVVLVRTYKKEYAQEIVDALNKTRPSARFPEDKMHRMSMIREAVIHHKYKWPEQLTSGVMFYRGERITIKEFNQAKKELK